MGLDTMRQIRQTISHGEIEQYLRHRMTEQVLHRQQENANREIEAEVTMTPKAEKESNVQQQT